MTPVLRTHSNWKRLFMAGAIWYFPQLDTAAIVFHNPVRRLQLPMAHEFLVDLVWPQAAISS
jgi:hypothetical protein